MADPNHLSKLLEGVDAWNNWRIDNNIPVDLSWSDLAGQDLTGADLRFVNFEHANLRGTILGPQTLAWSANFNGSDMYKANLRGAELLNANFTDADLCEADLSDSILRCANLSDVRGALRQEQLSGADITDAALPARLGSLLERLDNVKHISESARKLFLAVLAACLYSWLTIATTTDVNLITNRSSSPLPVIQTTIPIVGFYWVAPLLLLCVYFYFHFYLQKLWEELGSLPATLQDGRPLHTKVDPWLLNDLVRSHLPLLNVSRPFLSYFQLWISVLLAWWMMPLTMLFFWGRYLTRHESIGTIFHIVLLVISLIAAGCLYRLAVGTLRRTERKPFTWSRALKSGRVYRIGAVAVSVGILFALISAHALKATWLSETDPIAWIGYFPVANLKSAEVSQKKSTWSRDRHDDPDSVIGAQLAWVDLRFAQANRAFFAWADLTRADLAYATLDSADLTGATLTGADLIHTALQGADLAGADLESATLDHAYLSRANFTGADLSHTKSTGAVRLDGADLTRANLTHAYLEGVNLTGAKLIGANLSDAHLASANCAHADLTGADLRDADLRGADLTYSQFREVKNLEYSQIRSGRNWDKAFYNNSILKALGLPADHNANLAEQEEAERHEFERQEVEWQKKAGDNWIMAH